MLVISSRCLRPALFHAESFSVVSREYVEFTFAIQAVLEPVSIAAILN